MRQYLPRNLFLSSIFFFLLYSCSPVATYKLKGKALIGEKEIKSLIPKTGSLLFKAKIDLYSKHYSGLMILKQTDSLTSHLTFVTEVGMKMFDFEIKDHVLKLVYIFEPLNKPKLIQLLTADLELLLLQKAMGREASVYINSDRTMYKIRDKKIYYYLANQNQSIVSTTGARGSFGIQVTRATTATQATLDRHCSADQIR